MTEAGVEEIEIVDRAVAKEVGDRIEVEWSLNAEPELEWLEIFQLTTPLERQGPVDWVKGGGPDVIDSAIRWIIPEDELDAADAEVRYRLSVANRRTETDLTAP
jgi:hypothetical protein